MASLTPHAANFPLFQHLAHCPGEEAHTHLCCLRLQKVKICNSSQSKKIFLMAAILKVTNILHSCE